MYCFCNGLKRTSDSFCIIERKAISLTRNYVNILIFPNQFSYFRSSHISFLVTLFYTFLFNITCLTCSSYRFINYLSNILADGQISLHVRCPKCNQHFCLDCDIYIHESLHNCPGCESQCGFSS
jgi:hypothetical protein